MYIVSTIGLGGHKSKITKRIQEDTIMKSKVGLCRIRTRFDNEFFSLLLLPKAILEGSFFEGDPTVVICEMPFFTCLSIY